MPRGQSHKRQKSDTVRALVTGIAAAALLATAPCTAGQQKDAKPAAATNFYTVPSHMCGSFFLVPLSVPVKGSDQRRELTFLFDTGASISSVDPDSIASVVGHKVRTGDRVDLINAHAGPLVFNRLAASVRNLDHLAQALGRPFDGILGFSAFRDFLLTVDYPHKRIRLSRGKLPSPDGREIFDAKGPDSRPFLRIKRGSRTHRVLIDSGSASTFALRARKNMHWRSGPVPVKAFMRVNRLEMRKAGRLREDMRFGAHRIKEPLVYLTTNETELMGAGTLKHFTVTFDQKNRRVRLHRPQHTPIEMAPLSDTGAMLRPRPDGLQVVTVLKGTPAQEAGLRPGDLIVTANGHDAAQRGCPGAGENTPGAEITYEVKRGRDMVTVNVRKTVLVE